MYHSSTQRPEDSLQERVLSWLVDPGLELKLSGLAATVLTC